MECLTAELAIKNSHRVEIFYHRDPASIWHTYSTLQAIDPPSTFATASLVFLHDNPDLDPALTHKLSPILLGHLTRPEGSEQPFPALPRGKDSVSDTLDQLSNQTDALMTIPPGKVADAVGAFGALAAKAGSPHSPPRNPRNILSTGGSPIKWPTHDSVSNRSLSSPSRVGASAMATTTASSERRKASDSGSRSDVAVEDTHSLETFSTASYLASFVGQEPIETTRDISKNIATGTVQATSPQQAIALSTPPQSPSPPPPPPSPLFTPYSSPPPSPPQPPPPARAKLGYLPSSPVAITPGYVSLTETDQAPESNPPPGTPDRERVDEDGRNNTTQTPPRNRAALVCTSSPNQRKTLGSALGESAAIRHLQQTNLQEKKLGSSSKERNSGSSIAEPNPSKQNQNPLNFFLDPTPIKIYSALTCGLACGALVAVAVPSAPITVPAVIIGAGVGAVAGWSIASGSSNKVTKQNEP